MWEHAQALLGIPAAVKAALEVLEKLKAGTVAAPEAADNATKTLYEIQKALSDFAFDAVELAAFKDLHTITNQFEIDLKETRLVCAPDERRSREYYNELLNSIKDELATTRRGAGAAARFADLRDTPDRMKFMLEMPEDVSERIIEPPWDQYFWRLLSKSEREVDNYKNFSAHIREFFVINFALNNYANRKIVRGIEQFDKVMAEIRGKSV